MHWFKSWWARRWPGVVGRRGPLSERQQALDLIAAIDRGGLPLNPARVNQIARNLGLDVSSRAPMQDTVARIRQALARCTR